MLAVIISMLRNVSVNGHIAEELTGLKEIT